MDMNMKMWIKNIYIKSSNYLILCYYNKKFSLAGFQIYDFLYQTLILDQRLILVHATLKFVRIE